MTWLVNLTNHLLTSPVSTSICMDIWTTFWCKIRAIDKITDLSSTTYYNSLTRALFSRTNTQYCATGKCNLSTIW